MSSESEFLLKLKTIIFHLPRPGKVTKYIYILKGGEVFGGGTMHTEYRGILISLSSEKTRVFKYQVRKLEIQHRGSDRREVNGREVDKGDQGGEEKGREGRRETGIWVQR